MAFNDYIILIPSLITAIATSISAFLLLKATKPFISIRFEPDMYDHLSMNLVIENLGQSSAKDVKFKVTPDLEMLNGLYLSHIGLFQKGLPIFTPHHKIITYLTWMPFNYETKIKTPSTIEVSYKYFLFTKIQKYEIDFSLYGLVPLKPNPLSKIAESIEKIEGNLHSIERGSGKIHVVTQTDSEYKRELQKWLDEHKHT
jgi:hypothetical protein